MLDEKKRRVSITKGMANAAKQIARSCSSCGLKIPVYPGAYPKSCPDCGTALDTPSVGEQIELVKAGVPASEVTKMAQPDIETASLEEADPIGDIERLVRGAVGGAKRAKERVKKKKGEVKKHVGAAKKAGRKVKARKTAAKIGTLKKKEKKYRAKAAAGKDAKAGRRAAAAKKKREKITAKARTAAAKRQRRTRKESALSESWFDGPAAVGSTREQAIRNSIMTRIAESGSADVSKVARDFKANPVALYNLVSQRQDEWGLVIGGNGYTVYPRKAGERIQDRRE